MLDCDWSSDVCSSDLPNADGALKDGMVAAVRLEGLEVAAPQAQAASVPLLSVVRPPDDPKGYMVFVAVDKDGKTLAQARRVELGDVAGRNVSVRRGLSPGERVVTSGATLIHDGAAVTIVP
jgi:multidrug efflux pump subunit AcrA (membrane-fusion protein)